MARARRAGECERPPNLASVGYWQLRNGGEVNEQDVYHAPGVLEYILKRLLPDGEVVFSGSLSRHLGGAAGTPQSVHEGQAGPGSTPLVPGQCAIVPTAAPDCAALGSVDMAPVALIQTGPQCRQEPVTPPVGQRRRDYRKAWATACRKAGVPGRLRHDFRRTAVPNLVNAGVLERVAMKVTGHRTRSVFDRYHITSPADLQDVARRLTGTIAGTVPSSEVAPRSVSSDNSWRAPVAQLDRASAF